MPDLRDETTEDGFHEIQLSGKQLVFLFMLTTVLSIFIFLVGVLVGRDVAAKPGDDPISASQATPPEAPTETPGPDSPPSDPPPAATEADLDYHRRLQSDADAKQEKLPAPVPEPRAEPAKPAEKPKPTPTPTPTPAPAGPNVPTSGRPGTWVIQVIALKDRAAAASLVQRLAGKGYPAFLENPAPGTPVIYRVRVGRYNERTEAEQVGRRLKEEQYGAVILR